MLQTQLLFLTPGAELKHRAGIRLTSVAVTDSRREELDDAYPRPVTGVSEQRRCGIKSQLRQLTAGMNCDLAIQTEEGSRRIAATPRCSRSVNKVPTTGGQPSGIDAGWQWL